ncbi:Hypothetical predicted protein [Paramuricea clavata]|uniref:Uncharacterized protein n=1 Tax=Paramuricea clavata TaxID=317549 RepID=A0A6S7GG07_PARCT|nr:Hypothetical predicted protein [Paramuricea clavata]
MPLGGQRIRLKPGSVPTKFIFTVKKPERKKPCYRETSTSTGARTRRKVVRKFNFDSNIENLETVSDAKSEQLVCSEGNPDLLESDDPVESNSNENELLTRELKLKEEEMSRLHEELQRKDREYNANIMELEALLNRKSNAINKLELPNRQKLFNVETVKNNNKLFRCYTGFENFEIFSMVLDFLGREAASHLDYRNNSNSTSDSRKYYMYKPGPSRTLSVENEFFMVLCRLKVGLLEDDFASRFGLGQSVVSQIINTWIRFMFFRFKELDVFPSKEVVKLHMPECFMKKYPSTSLIIDATEIYIEKPNNPVAQQLTFSSYKNTNTLKALTGIVPKGGI